MSADGALDRIPGGRVSTGTPGLDAMLEGGLVARRPYLIVGPSGTGKTTLALQFLVEGIRRGERVLLVTMEEPPNEMRINHRLLGPELLKVEVFDAIPDIMRYERVPFKDIASVRQATPFGHVPLEIRRSPELTAVEVTMTALEQMLRSEIQRRTYSRVVVDSLTALQYFCMKGFDPVAGAQAFLRFLSDLHVTTILTVEAPLEDVETPERMLARGEIRLFRWELDGRTVRAVGVEKFRGSSHDVRLHPYRIGPQGIDVNLEVTISRDTRQIIEPPRPTEVALEATEAPPEVEEVISPLDPLAEEVQDLVLVGAEVGPLRTEIESAFRAASEGDLALARGRLSRANALVIGLSDSLADRMKEAVPKDPQVAEAYQRILQRSEAARAGMPPTKLPPPKLLEVQLEWVLSLLPEVPSAPAATSSVVPEAPAPLGAEVPSVLAESDIGASPEPVLAPPLEPPPSEVAPSLPASAPAETEVRASSLPPTEASVEGTGPTSEIPTPFPEPASSSTGPPIATAVRPSEPAVREGAVPAPSGISLEPPTSVPVPAGAASPPEVASPSVAAVAPSEGSPPETVERILAAPGSSHEVSPASPPPAKTAPSPPTVPAPPLPTGPLPLPEVQTLPPPASHEAEAPARPLRAWTPPALPVSPRRPVSASRGEPRASVPPSVKAEGPVGPVPVRERRPPLPKSVGALPSPPERHLPLEAVREAPSVRAPAAPPGIPSRPPAAVPAAPSSAPPAAPSPPASPPVAAAAAPKRKRKVRTPPARKKTAAGASVAIAAPAPLAAASPAGATLPTGTALPGAVEAASVPPPTKPKRRPARKRKAPPVVAARPGPAPSADAGGASAPAPPLPTPPSPPPTEGSSPEESR